MSKYLIIAGLFFGLLTFQACTKQDEGDLTDKENNDENNGQQNQTKGITFSIIKDGSNEDISITEYIGWEIEVDEIDGYDIKKLEIYTGYEDTYPKISMNFPYKIGQYLIGTTYGSDSDYMDDIGITLSEDETYEGNTKYQSHVDNWVQPWINVTNISDNGSITAEFGGTYIKHVYGDDTYETLEINNGKLFLEIEDDYLQIVDEGDQIANDPILIDEDYVGPNNVIALFEVSVPGSYVAGEDMYFDTVSFEFINLSENATYFEWELTRGDYWYDDNYFYYENTNGQYSSFTETFYLKNMLDTNEFTVKLTAYDEWGNSQSHFETVKIPMLKGQLYVNGERANTDNLRYHLSNISEDGMIQVFGLDYNYLNVFNFAQEGYFPMPGSFNDPIFQTGERINEEDEVPTGMTFFLQDYRGWETFPDPNGEYSGLIIDNTSVLIQKAEIYQIYGSIYAEYTLNNESRETGTIEIRYLASDEFFELDW